MNFSMVSEKGGVAKTTSAIHLAAHLAYFAPTLILDQDRSGNASGWATRGNLPIKALRMNQKGVHEALREHTHLVIDTRGGMDDQDLKDVYENSDQVIIPVVPDMMTLQALEKTANVLRGIDPTLSRLRVLFTMVRKIQGRSDAMENARNIIETHYDIRCLKATIRQTEAFREASNQGQLVKDTRNALGKTAWLDYEQALREIAPQLWLEVKAI